MCRSTCFIIYTGTVYFFQVVFSILQKTEGKKSVGAAAKKTEGKKSSPKNATKAQKVDFMDLFTLT